MQLAVNLSAPDILDPDLGDGILRMLSGWQVEPAALLLEITESAVMRDPELAARHIQPLRAVGVRFSLDDFGTGHSSQSLLSRLPVDELKIDRSFISHALAGQSAAAIVASTVALAHGMAQGRHPAALRIPPFGLIAWRAQDGPGRLIRLLSHGYSVDCAPVRKA